MNVFKKYQKQICTAIILFICTSCKLTFIPISDIQFTSEYNPDVNFCFPAAYTNDDGSIQGEYIINGRIYGTPSRKERISIHPIKGLVVSGQWHSNNGFQQTVLVKNGKPRSHNDPKRRIRRALCNETSDSKSLLIVQSTYPMTLTEFANELQHYCYTAVNLDTGNFGYGWYKHYKFHWWTFFNKHKQTNWITC